MKTINVFTENIYSAWKLDEKDVIDKTRKMLEYFVANLGSNSCLSGEDFDTLTLDIVFCSSAKTHELNRD